MATKKLTPASSPKRPSTKIVAATKSVGSLQEAGIDAPAPRKNRSRRSASPLLQKQEGNKDASAPETGVKPAGFFVGREGVAFGPYTEFQLRESVRLGIFESDDLALAEDGKEWMEISRVLPVNRAPRERQPDQPLATPPGVEEGSTWMEVSRLLPLITTPRERPQPNKARFKPLTEQQLREHELLSCHSPISTFIRELTRGRLVFAAIPVAVIFLTLLTLAVVLKHHEPSTVAAAHPRSPHAAPAVQAPGEIQFPLTTISLSARYVPPFDLATAMTPEKLTATTRTPDAVLDQGAPAGHAP